MTAAELASLQRRFAAACDGWERAASHAGWSSRDFLVAGRRLRIRVAGAALAPLVFRAFEHLAAPPGGDPDAVISAWDSRSTGIPLPAEVGPLSELHEHGLPAADATGGIASSYLRFDTGLSMFDHPAAAGLFWVSDAGILGHEWRANPLRGLVRWWLAPAGLHLMHAAAVAPPGGGPGLLLTGPSGAGKSTTALACAVAGFRVLADDMALIAVDTGQGWPMAWPLYPTAKVTMERAGALGVPAAALEPPRLVGEKALVWLDRLAGAASACPFPVAAVVVPRTGYSATAVRPASRGTALAALAPSTLLLPGGGAAHASMAAMTRLITRLPAFTLELGPDPASAPPVLARLTAGLAEDPP
jgi:hypothetical protein